MVKRRCKLTAYKQSRLLDFFVGGVTSRTAAELMGINRHSATLYYQKIRQMIACELEDENPFYGSIELDESYFGGHRKSLPPQMPGEARTMSKRDNSCFRHIETQGQGLH